ncbi:DoxX family protein [Puteibacter caeruleilacunae]|nr:DoxX family protein [Puteibacter caeruleilacunae]
MKALEYMNNIESKLSKLTSLPLLFLRLILAYGFYNPAIMKWKNIEGIGDWFASMNYPLPMLNAYLAASTEALGVILLFLGLGTRIIAIPLMFVMLVAIVTVHGGNGFEASANGFEIPLYYLLMLFCLLIYGSGKYSIDHFFKKTD